MRETYKSPHKKWRYTWYGRAVLIVLWVYVWLGIIVPFVANRILESQIQGMK